MNTLQAVDWRYAVQKFDTSKQLSEEKLEKILEVARKAPSAMNFQPWKFIVVRDKKLREEIQKVGFNQPKIVDSPVLVVMTYKTNLTTQDTDKMLQETAKQRGLKIDDLAGYRSMIEGFIQGKDQKTLGEWSRRQTYIALGFLLLAAATLEVDAGPMEGFSPEGVDKVLGLAPTGYASTALVALGYRDSTDPSAAYKKVRFEKKDVVLEI